MILSAIGAVASAALPPVQAESALSLVRVMVEMDRSEFRGVRELWMQAGGHPRDIHYQSGEIHGRRIAVTVVGLMAFRPSGL